MNPYLSLVTVTRNDDYAGGMLKRLQFCLDILYEQIERYKLECELIIVDWNPPAENIRLKDALIFPVRSDYMSIRIIEVDNKYHKKFKHNEVTPINGNVGANVGFRRARGKFNVLRNSDIIYSNELFAFIAQKKLNKNILYTCQCPYINEKILDYPDWTTNQKIDYCNNNVIFKNKNLKIYQKGIPNDFFISGTEFNLLSNEARKKLRSFRETESVITLDGDLILLYCAYASRLKIEMIKEGMSYKIYHKNMGANRLIWTKNRFFLDLSRKINLNLMYHLVKISRTTRLSKIFYDKKPRQTFGVQFTSKEEYYDLLKKIVSGDISYVMNDENWGLGQESLPEYKVLTHAC